MSLELMIRAHNAEDLRAQLADLLGGVAVAAPAEVVKTVKAETKTKVVEPKPEPEPEKVVEAEAPTAEQVVESATDSNGDVQLTYEADIKPAVLKVSAKHGRPGVEKLLADFEVANAKEVPEAKWPELLAAIDKLLEG